MKSLRSIWLISHSASNRTSGKYCRLTSTARTLNQKSNGQVTSFLPQSSYMTPATFKKPLSTFQPINHKLKISSSVVRSIMMTSESERIGNDSSNDTHYKYYIRSFITAMISSCIFMWITDRQFFTVEAAKPIYDYGNETEQEARLDVEKRSYIEKDPTSIKKKKSKRDRYNFIADVVEAVADTVVCIEIKDHASIDWFTGVPQTASNGSGFIISKDGLILTNAHVVTGCQRASISVRLSDGKTYSAQIEDIDYESDLATVRINAINLPTMPLGSSCDTKIGEWVVALGSPLSLTNTITAGVVSSVNRGASELGIRNGINYIQTDAAITFGNSGGPLINLDGEAIGINSMKVTAGISFAIPIDHAKKFLAKSEARKSSGKKKPVRRYMGITILTVTEQLKRELGSRGEFTDVKSGVLVWQVVVGSPAYLAGIKPGDIIIRINGTDIKTSADLYSSAKTADKLHVHVQRGEKVYACVVTPEFIEED